MSLSLRLAHPLHPRQLATAVAASLTLALAGCASSGPGTDVSGAAFTVPDADFKGRVNLVDTPVVLAGKPVQLAGSNFVPGQRVTLSHGGVVLAGPLTVDADGKFRTQFTVPAQAAAGRYQLVVSATHPTASLLVPFKVSPDVPLVGQERFQTQFQPLTRGLYQSAYSAKSDRIFITSAVGRPPVSQSELLKVHPQTLAVEARVTPATAAGGGVYAVYGLGVDDANGTVWVTNTRQNTVAVYRQSDLKLLKQFEPGTVPHARDVVIDTRRGKVYASPVGRPQLVVFDAKSLTKTGTVALTSTRRGPDAKEFSPMSLALDEASGRLFAVSLSTNEVAIVDTASDRVTRVLPLEGAQGSIGVAHDARDDRLYVTAQGSDNLLIVDVKTGKLLHEVKTGAGALNVAFEPVHRLAYVVNRGAGTVTVVTPDGRIVANLPAGTNPNHITVDGKGSALSINKARGENDPQGDRIGRIAPRG